MAPLLAVPATVNSAPGFGRLENSPEHCSIVVVGRSLACESHSRNVAGMSVEAELQRGFQGDPRFELGMSFKKCYNWDLKQEKNEDFDDF